MNKRDRDNLNFLMSANPQTLAAWSLTATEDDLQYAAELLAQHESDLNSQEMELLLVDHQQHNVHLAPVAIQ